ncbi:MAG TPA: prephenate dehydrogenase/arogenate dehydrogenase family protein [Candidatus Xenobia bacterium]|jgi:chorismate mutase/prephenate dehydrogenase
MSDLQSLRQDIGAIDREILGLVQRRMDLARQVGDQKAGAGLPVRDFRREVVVLERARETCAHLGLDTEMGETLIRHLIEGAVRTQHTFASARGTHATPQRILVIGGCGRMGSWLCSFFHAQGHLVTVHDVQGETAFPRHSDLAAAVKAADAVVLSTPIGLSTQMLQAVLAVDADPIVFDIASLKSPLLDTIEQAVKAGRKVCSVHPMFAPGAVLLSGRVLLVCECGQPEATAAARHLFEGTALRMVDVPVQQHDRLMGVVLGLSHAVNIAFAKALHDIGIAYPELDKTTSTTFGRQIRTTAEVAAENPQLYYEIQHYNRYTPDMLAALQKAVGQVAEAAAQPDSRDFTALMQEGHGFFTAEAASGAGSERP